MRCSFTKYNCSFDVTFDDFVDVNKDLATWGELNDEDLVKNSKGLQTEEEAYEIDEDQDDPGMEFEPPSTLETIKALKIVRNHISFNDKLNEVYIKNVIILERVLEVNYFLQSNEQTKITDFFGK
ncbi:hypothetical protein QE152_g26470 [Popillia japonica]|uniref:Uncharacterized protein n=1 Tax=Popillia japonica TaxID=7064 RepID=A0AAW1JYB1_POPJA